MSDFTGKSRTQPALDPIWSPTRPGEFVVGTLTGRRPSKYYDLAIFRPVVIRDASGVHPMAGAAVPISVMLRDIFNDSDQGATFKIEYKGQGEPGTDGNTPKMFEVTELDPAGVRRLAEMTAKVKRDPTGPGVMDALGALPDDSDVPF